MPAHLHTKSRQGPQSMQFHAALQQSMGTGDDHLQCDGTPDRSLNSGNMKQMKQAVLGHSKTQQ